MLIISQAFQLGSQNWYKCVKAFKEAKLEMLYIKLQNIQGQLTNYL